jgi:hypothetical protein
MQREEHTIKIMIGMFCRDNHGVNILCNECSILQEYALKRLELCPFQEGKTTCARCPVHCYKKEMREKIRKVMRYSGPRMLPRYPMISVMHIIDGIRVNPIRKRRGVTPTRKYGK